MVIGEREYKSASYLCDKGRRKSASGNVDEAIRNFTEALEVVPGFKYAHYGLACCYSLKQDPTLSIRHLHIAVTNNFTDLETIQSDPALSFLRAHELYTSFAKSGFSREWTNPSDWYFD
ncbi:MAG: tetratricopeptide repeat protein [Acidobacteriota bacterium]